LLIWTLRGKALAALALIALAGCGAVSAERHDAPGASQAAALAGRLLDGGLEQLQVRMGPASLALARRSDAVPHPDFWDRSPGWARLELDKAPALPFAVLGPGDAEALNAFLPAAGGPLTPAQPFVLAASGAERERAALCLTQAIYYEAATEPLSGQQAVAQTVLNRLRHPDFPKSVCGVVYEGAAQITGCQFSFTCDGSRERAPIEPYWGRARAVAEAALAGFVQKEVGPATHYHADYVFPRWGPEMVKIGQIGAHIFYRYPGPLGRVEELTGRYLGGELNVSMAGPSPGAIAAARAAAAASGAPVGAVIAAAAPVSPTDMRPRVAGQIIFGRRIPSKDEIGRINGQLATLNGETPGAAAPRPAGAPTPTITPPPFADKLPLAPAPRPQAGP
jgi:spore germination cell wall hydrolase CwlJ-like protein